MDVIEKQRFGEERALYGSRNLTVKNCRFEGKEDGESALKESKSVKVADCFFDLRYPFWHNDDLLVTSCEMTEKCRAAFWYDRGVFMDGCRMHGVKAFRECSDVTIKDSDVLSPEVGWNCRGVVVEKSAIGGEYAFFGASNVRCDHMEFNGKYSFQYVMGGEITDSTLTTKDAFWHSEGITVRNSTVRGEYLGWYSKNLTLINCKISGTQPFCYCENLTLIDCETEDCDLAFEYSSVNATVKGHVVSIKNPKSGSISCDSVGEIIRGDTVYDCDCRITVGGVER